MPEVSIDIKGEHEIIKLAREIQTLRPVKSGLRAGASFLKGKIARYPMVRRRTMNFVSDQQRRHFFWLMNTGRIEVPYRRGISEGSERHGQSWTVQERRGGLTQVIGSDTSYGPLLQSRDQQTEFHREGGWETVEDLAEEHAEEVNRRLKVAMDRALRRLGR